jgi:hypothetical protein
MMVKQNFELHRLSIANFVDLVETNKKVIESNLPGSLLCVIRSTVIKNNHEIIIKIVVL